MAASKNPIAAYAEREKIGPTELARRLKTSKGSASEYIAGKRKIGPKVARRMAALTGKPWHLYVTEGIAA